MDTGAAFTGGAGNDTFNATVATLGSLDVVDAGAGTDTLSVVETNSITTWGDASLSGFEKAVVTTAGSIGSIKASPVDVAARAQISALSFSNTFAAGDTITVQIGTATYTATVGSLSTSHGRDEAITAVKDVITAHLGDSVSFGGSIVTGTGANSTTITNSKLSVTSAVAGKPLPAITLTKGAYASSTASASFTSTTSTQSASSGGVTTATNRVQTGSVALKESSTVTIDTPVAATKVVFSVNGTDYTTNFASSTDATVVAAAATALINQVLGTTGAAVQTASTGIIKITAATAGTALPAMNLKVLKSDDSAAAADTWVFNTGNATATAAATSAVALAAPSGVVDYSATATGVANVSGAATTNIVASGTVVQVGTALDATVTASDSVYVSGAKGVVKVTQTAAGSTDTTIYGAVAADVSGGSATDAAGIYVTGGTSVTIIGNKYTGDVKVGAAPYAKAAVSTTGYPESNGNNSKTPTGDVSITNVTRSTDTTTGTVTGTYGTGAASVYTNGATTVTVKGAGTTTITDANTLALKADSGATAVSGTSKLATVNLAGLSNNATIKSDAISTVSVSDTLSARTVTVSNSGTTGANSGAINLQVSNVGTGDGTRLTLDNATATSVNVSSAAASAYATVGTTATNSGSKSWITLTTPKATTITMTNDKSVDLGDLSANGLAKLATVSGSGATGAIAATVGATSEQGLSFTSGSGNDTVTIKSGASLSANAVTAATTKISLGAGNDKLLNGSTSTHTVVGATFDGGEGDDTLAASLLTVGNGTQFTNFEVLGLDLTSTSMDTTLMSGATSLSLLAQGGTYTNVKASQGLTVGADLSVATTTLSFGSAVTASTAQADAYTVTMNYADTTTAASSSANVVDAGVLVLTGIEDINIVSSGSGNISNAINLVDTSAHKVVVTGSIDLDLDFGTTDGAEGGTTNVLGKASTVGASDGLGVSLIDASGFTGKLNVDTTDVILAASTSTLTVKGGSGNDTITLAGKSSVDAGAGNDTITPAARGVSSTLTGGAGNDTFDLSSTGVAASGDSATASTATVYMTTITDFSAGDVLKLGATTIESGVMVNGNAAVVSAVSLFAALDAALKATTSTTGITADVGDDVAVWFNYGGDTYIAREVAVSGTSADGLSDADIVVKLTGIHTLTAAAVSAAATGLFGEA